MPRDSVSLPQARRIALAAQGFAAPRPTGRVDMRHVRGVLNRLGAIQIDSVNVLVRSHELPLFARLGPHPRGLVERMVQEGDAFEYWGHMASFLPVELYPLLRWRMDAFADGEAWTGLIKFHLERPGYIDEVYEEVARRGPISAGELEDAGGRTGPWWGWKDGKRGLELLFWAGRISARRRTNFERVYDLTERLLPARVVNAPVPSEPEARKELLRRSARAVGIGTARDLADYYRLNIPKARPLLKELVEAGELHEVHVDGWRDRAYLHPDAKVPRRVQARALLSPFDSLVWERSRNERLFEFHYRLEIYTPAPKRKFGYYVLPFLLGEQLVARVDLKSDRQASTLRVFAAKTEDGVEPSDVAEPLAAELALLAGWLGLERVHVTRRGNLARALEAAAADPTIAAVKGHE